MPALDDWISAPSPREREAVEASLRKSEQLRWVVRPQPRLRDCVRWDLWLFGLLWTTLVTIGVLVSTRMLPDAFIPADQKLADWSDAPFFAAFLLVGLLLLCWPLVTLHRTRRSLYLLTQRRAIILEPALRGWRRYYWPLNDRLLLLRQVAPDGSGNLRFSRVYHYDANRSRDGYIGLPDVSTAESRIDSIVAERRSRQGVASEAASASAGKRVEDFISNLSPREREEVERALFRDEHEHIIWADRSLSGVVLGGWQDFMHLFTGDHHLVPQLYVLTERRALLLQPRIVGPWKTRAYPIHTRMVISRKLRQQGRGDLVFEEETKKNSTQERGFMNLRDLAAAEQAIKRVIAQRTEEKK